MSLTVDQVKKMFAPLADPATQKQFVEHIDENVECVTSPKPAHACSWTIAGPNAKQAPFGQYHSRKDFLEKALGPVGAAFEGGIALVIEHEPIVTGDRALVELRAADKHGKTPTGKNGTVFDNRYAWVVTIRDDKIVQARAYLDTRLVLELLDRL